MQVEKHSQINDLLRLGVTRLEMAGVESAQLECLVLLAASMGVEKERIIAHPEQVIQQFVAECYLAMLERRLKREPLAYILGRREFYGLTVKVSSAVLIPRPETELLVDEIIANCAQHDVIADIGTGSGAIVLAAAEHCPQCTFYAVDYSANALEVAEQNLSKLIKERRVKLLKGSFTEPLSGKTAFFDIVVSNPPYIPSAELEMLQPEVRLFEPYAALDGGIDGLDAYRHIVGPAFGLLKSGGLLALEVGAGQADSVKELMLRCGYKDVRFKKDLSGIDRVVTGRR